MRPMAEKADREFRIRPRNCPPDVTGRKSVTHLGRFAEAEPVGRAGGRLAPPYRGMRGPWIAEPSARKTNVFSVDVEDYFQVEAFSDIVPRERWSSYTLRVDANTRRILDL